MEHYENHLSVRIDRTIKQLIQEVAQARRERPSDFARRAILTELAKLSYLSNSEKKALGISGSSPLSNTMRDSQEPQLAKPVKPAKDEEIRQG